LADLFDHQRHGIYLNEFREVSIYEL
jgi:hypothetical protein